MSQTTERFITLEEAGRRLNVNPQTLRRRIAEGQLPAYHVGTRRAIRVKPSDVDALIVRIPTAATR